MNRLALPVLIFLTFFQSLPAAERVEDLNWQKGTKVLVVGGGTSHDFQKWFGGTDVATLRTGENLSINYTESSAVAARHLTQVDVLVFSADRKGFDTPDFRTALMAFADAGKGIVLVHSGVGYHWLWPEYNTGLAGGGARSHDPIQEFEVNLVQEHPVTRGLPRTFRVTDELFHVLLDPSGPPVEILLQTSAAQETKNEHPCVWLVKHARARIVCIALGHDGRVHELPEYKRLLRQAVEWVAEK
jgi:type 1 glutamine amidotransferase